MGDNYRDVRFAVLLVLSQKPCGILPTKTDFDHERSRMSTDHGLEGEHHMNLLFRGVCAVGCGPVQKATVGLAEDGRSGRNYS